MNTMLKTCQKKLTSGFVKVESKTFLDEEGNEFQETFGRLVGLNKLVDSLLDLYDERKMLTWHKDTIPVFHIMRFGLRLGQIMVDTHLS